MVKGIALTSKASAVRSGDDADMTGRQAEHFGQVPMQIVHVLGGSPERELAVMAELRQACMLFQGEVGAAFIERDVFPYEVGIGKACFHVAEFVNLSAMDIAELTILVDTRLGVVVRIGDRRDGPESFVFDFDQVQSFGCRIFIDSRDGGHRISYHSHSVYG